jgi:Fe-S-cluster containining protein
MKCQQCGVCCTLRVELVLGLDDIPDRMVEFIKEDDREIPVMKRINGRCIALTSDNKCSIYFYRPMECKDFRAGESRCRGKEEL